jgi:hypothetical protein
MLLTAEGLRETRPSPGDVVSLPRDPTTPRIISSIGEDGRVYLKGRPSARSWPNYITTVARAGDSNHASGVHAADAASRNAMRYSPDNSANFSRLEPYSLESFVPSDEAVRALETVLDSGERREERLQQVLTAHPALLAPLVVGSWNNYVIPKVRLGSEHVTDYLVMGLNSLGPQWVAVEIEGQQHQLETRSGSLSAPTRHAVEQINDWREWLTTNIAYAHSALGLYGITNRVPGLVIIGRSDPTIERRAARSRSGEDSNIAIHSWDWLLRNASNLRQGGRSDFADAGARAMLPVGLDPRSLVPRRSDAQ